MRPDSVGACSWLAVAMMVLATSGVTTTTVVSDSVLTDAVTTTASAETATAPVTNSTAATTTRSTSAALGFAAASDATTDEASSSHPATTATAANASASSESESTVTTGAAAVSMATSSGNTGYLVSEPTSAAAESSSATSTEAVTSNASAAVGATTQKVTANDSLTHVASTSTATSEAPTTTAAATHSSSTTSGGGISMSSTTMLTSTTKPTSSTDPVVAYVVGGVVGGVFGVIVILVVVGLAIHCRRRMVPMRRSTIPPMPSMPTPAPPELVKLSKPVNLADFPDYVKQMSADSCYGFAEEFDGDLKNVGRGQSTIAASLAHNLVKNRFTNILPYDHSRVKLFTSGGPDKSDYINANYIPGHNDSKEFIATQGPMQSTTNDFWRMVWEQQCKAIVMLTRCTEGLVDKCHHYWPAGHDTVTYGGVTVQVTDELEQPYWTVTDFCVSEAADAVGSGREAAAAPPSLAEAAAAAASSLQLRQQRHVRHFHYTAFPDHKAPPDAESMLQFVRLVRSKLTRSPGGPVVVHCSAGVGRSGTYIAIDRILQQVEDGCSSVDLFGAVREMRLHRMYMVQAEEQYVFIHQIIEQELQLRRHSKDTSNGIGIDNKAFAGE